MKRYLALSLVSLMLLALPGWAADREHTLKVYNWADYIDESLLDEFEVWYKEQTGEEVETVTIIPKEWVVYTVIYCGEDYFADEVFKLTEEQKRLAKEYAQNLDMYINNGI